jgi:hypothetical protein
MPPNKPADPAYGSLESGWRYLPATGLRHRYRVPFAAIRSSADSVYPTLTRQFDPDPISQSNRSGERLAAIAVPNR